MNHRCCAQLEEYLSAALTEPEAAKFEAHLSGCDDCRHELSLEEAIGRLLNEAAERFDPCPPTLATQIPQKLRRKQLRRNIWVASGWCGAAVVLFSVGWLVWNRAGHEEPGQQTDTDVKKFFNDDSPNEATGNLSQPEPVEATAAVQVRFSDDVIAVPIPTDHKDVTIFWVYPMLETAQLEVESAAPVVQ